jgi:hypothetical protein
MMGICPQARVPRSGGQYGRVRVRQIEFPSTVEADTVCTAFDREHAAEVTVPAAKGELKNPK